MGRMVCDFPSRSGAGDGRRLAPTMAARRTDNRDRVLSPAPAEKGRHPGAPVAGVWLTPRPRACEGVPGRRTVKDRATGLTQPDLRQREPQPPATKRA